MIKLRIMGTVSDIKKTVEVLEKEKDIKIVSKSTPLTCKGTNKYRSSESKCIRIMAEIDSKNGIGLIERKRRGQGKPDLIYVKNFTSFAAGMEQNLQSKNSQNKNSQNENSENKNSQNENPGEIKMQALELSEQEPNYTENNKPERKTISISSEPAFQMDAIDAYIALIKKNTCYDQIMQREEYADRRMYDELF